MDQGDVIDPPVGALSGSTLGVTGASDRLQTFTVGLDGQFVGLRLQLAGASGDATLPVSVVEITGTRTVGATLGTANLQTSDVSNDATSAAPQTVVLAFDPCAVQVGDNLGILMDGPDTGNSLFRFSIGVGRAFVTYDAGAIFISRDHSEFVLDSFFGPDLPFETLVDTGEAPEVVPAPPAASALLAGLGALALLRRRQRSVA